MDELPKKKCAVDPTAVNVNSDGIDFIRTGTCNRCGCCCKDCPHLHEEENGVFTCLIYDKRDQVCEFCKTAPNGCADPDGTHRSCISYPITPFSPFIKNGKCSYKFALKNPKDKAKFDEINSRW